MAKKKSTAATPYKRLEVSGRILQRIGIIAGKGMLERLWPEHKIIKRGSDVLRMSCPIHDDPNPSCDLNFVTGRIFCYGCKFRTSSVFEFLQQSKGWSYKTALDTLRQYVDLRAVSESTAREIHAVDVWQTATGWLMEIFNEHLQRLLVPNNHPLYTRAVVESSKPTLDWLFKHRKRDPDLVSVMPYGVMPPGSLIDPMLRELRDKMIDRRTAKDLAYPAKDWQQEVIDQANAIYKTIDTAYTHAVSYHMGYNFTTPGRIKLRRPTDDKHGNVIVVNGRIEDEPLGYFGLYRPGLVGRANLDVSNYRVPLVEGENDALALMEGVEREGKAGIVPLASGGTANDIDQLIDAQLEQVWIIGDEPQAGGNDFIHNKLSTAYEVDARVFNRWDKILRAYPTAKDPDEVVRVAGFDYAYRTFIDSPENYTMAAEWAFSRVQEDLAAMDVEEGNTRPAFDLINTYGPCVRHPSSQARFVALMAEMTKIPPGEIRQRLAENKGTESAFKAHLEDCIRREFVPLYCTQSLRSPVLRMFHKERRIAVEFPVNDGEAIGLSIARVHGSFYDFVREQVGIPTFLDKNDGQPNAMPEKLSTPALYDYAKLAMQGVLRGVPLRNDCEEYGQGGHLLPDPLSGDGQLVQFFNNGSHVYLGRPEAEGSAVYHWVELDGPAYGTLLFRSARAAWSEEIRSADDLNEGNHVTKAQLLDAIKKVETMVRLGWRFAHQDTDPTYLAYLLAAYAVSYAWPFKTILSIHGDTHSGKSTLLSLFCGVTHPALRMLEMSTSIDLFSEAGVYQKHSRGTQLLCFDEFEEDGDATQKQSIAVAGMVRMMRSVIGEKGSTVDRGATRGEDAPDYLIKTPIAFASIHRAKNSQDDNRRMDIETHKSTDSRDPAQTIFQHYAPDDLRAIRRLLSVGMPRFAQEFVRHFNEVRTRINTQAIIPFHVQVRYLNNYVPVCAMMAMLGQPWEAFLVDACKLRQTRLDMLSNETSASILYERLFRAANVHPVTGDQRTATRVTDHFRSAGHLDDLNRTRCGVFVYAERNLAIIDWITAQNKGGVLEGFNEYRTMKHHNLKHALDQHPKAMRTEDYTKYGIDRFVRSMGSSYNPSTISVVDVRHLIEEIRSEPDKTPVTGGERKDGDSSGHDSANDNNI